MAKIHVGLVGAGLIGRDHANCLHRNARVGAITIFDADAKRAQSVADEYRCSIAASIEDLIKNCDIVWIATPPFVHRATVEAACNAGKPVFCEKPLAHNLADAEAIRAVAQRTRVPFFMGHSGRFTTPLALMNRLVKEGKIGRPTLLTSTRLGYFDPKKSPAWRMDDEQSGGAIVEMGVHEIDFINWTGGPWQNVYAVGSASLVGPKCQDTVSAVGTLASGAKARVEMSWASARYLWERTVQGEEGNLTFNDSQVTVVTFQQPGKEPEIIPSGDTDWMDRATGENLTLRAQDDAVLAALESGDPPPVTLVEGLNALRVAMAIRKSIQSGKVEAI